MTNQNLKDFILDPISLRRDVRALMKKSFCKYLTPEMAVYDIGCGDKPFAPFLQGKVKSYIGVDVEDGFYDASHIDLVGTAYDVPIKEEEADAVISCQVLEHLQRPSDAMKESSRILRKGGILLISFPFMYPIHAAPVDYFRYTEFTADNFLKENGFELIEINRISGFWYALGLFSGMYLKVIDKSFVKKLKISMVITMIVKWFFFTFHWLEEKLFKLTGKDIESSRRDWTINYVIVARKI